MPKVDYKKDFKTLYQPPQKPCLIEVPTIQFLVIEGQGDPNSEAFAKQTEALYSLSYAVKMSYKGAVVPEGYYEYTVFPLEGVWDLVDKSKPLTDKSNYKYTLMIRQPDFLTTGLFEQFLEATMKKKPNPNLRLLKLVTLTEGLCCQMMHMGSYDEEPASFAQMEAYCHSEGYKRVSKRHREIYLSDPRKTAPEKCKTILRFNVSK